MKAPAAVGERLAQHVSRAVVLEDSTCSLEILLMEITGPRIVEITQTPSRSRGDVTVLGEWVLFTSPAINHTPPPTVINSAGNCVWSR